MTKNKPTQYIFKLVQGIWRNITGDSEILADFLERLELNIDDKTQYARIIDYENNLYYIFHRVNWEKITIEVWKINETY